MKKDSSLSRSFFPLPWRLLFQMLIFLLVGAIPLTSGALTPLKGLLLGEVEGEALANDPLPFLITEGNSEFSQGGERARFRAQLARYRGFYEEGENLENSCRALGEARYLTTYERDQAKRAVIAGLQYYAIDYLISALAQNASEREVSNVTYTTFVDQMIGSYCSANMTIISHRELKRQFMSRFERMKSGRENWEAPGIEDNSLFAEKLLEVTNREALKERELYVWSELFKSVCSWGGDTFDLRLMVPLVRDPVVMSHVFRTMAKLDIELNEKTGEIHRVRAPKAPQVACKNLICRKTKNDEEFLETFPRTIGSTGLLNDMQRLYCEDLRDVDYIRNNPVPQIKEILNQRTLDEEALLKGGLIALWSGVPDLMLYFEKFEDIQPTINLSYQRELSRWAQEQMAYGLADLTYEEPITYEVEERSLYWSPNDQKLKVVVDVNLGEFDRMNQSLGKYSLDLPLNISESFLAWLQAEWKNSVGLGNEAREQFVTRLSQEIENEIALGSRPFKLPLWPPEIARLVADELVTMLGYMRANPFERTSLKKVEIPLRLNFGLFAVKTLRDRFLIEKSIKEGKLLREGLELGLKNERERAAQEVSESEVEEQMRAP